MTRITLCLASLLLAALLATCDSPAPTTAPEQTPLLRLLPGSDGSSVLALWDGAEPGADGYSLTWSSGDGRMGSLDLPATSRTAHIAGLESAATVRLSARNGERLSPLADAQWIDQFLPGPPSGLRVVRNVDDNSAHVEWVASTDPTITGYFVHFNNGWDVTGIRLVGATTTSIEIDGLHSGATVAVTVAAMRGFRFSRIIRATDFVANDLGAPTNLGASSKSATSVGLRWDAVTGATGYHVSYVGAGAGGTGSVETSSSEVVIDGLTPGTIHTFTVTAINGALRSEPVSIAWAPADRFARQADTTKSIRMYEEASTEPSAIAIDPSLGGPIGVSLNPTRPGKGQLAMYVYPRTGSDADSIVVGPLYAITEYRIGAGGDLAKVDTSTYISSSTYNVESLDAWYMSGSLAGVILPWGNVAAYTFTNLNTGGQGFVVRTGTPGSYHYARVLIRSVNGSILQGIYPNRFVEVEISYQSVPNVPYAKRAARPGVPAARRY
jgi:hypothetical protein